jgi:hypothetical protein
MSWYPQSSARMIPVYAVLVAEQTHSIQYPINRCQYTLIKTFNSSDFDATTSRTVDYTFSLFIKQPVGSNPQGRAAKEFVFLRHNLEVDLMFTSCWKLHRFMVKHYIDENYEELLDIFADQP